MLQRKKELQRVVDACVEGLPLLVDGLCWPWFMIACPLFLFIVGKVDEGVFLVSVFSFLTFSKNIFVEYKQDKIYDLALDSTQEMQGTIVYKSTIYDVLNYCHHDCRSRNLFLKHKMNAKKTTAPRICTSDKSWTSANVAG